MIEKAVRDFGVDLGRSWVVGDSQVDADLVKNVGLRSVIARNGAVREVEGRIRVRRVLADGARDSTQG